MNRIFMQASVVVLFVLAVSAGVSAQSEQQYRAEIPFSFEAGGKHYAAGTYSVGPLSQVSSPGGIVIRDTQSKKSRILGVNSMHGDNNWDKPGTLTFLNVGGQYKLSQISTATFRMNLRGKGAKSSEMAERASSDSKEVAIALKR